MGFCLWLSSQQGPDGSVLTCQSVSFSPSVFGLVASAELSHALCVSWHMHGACFLYDLEQLITLLAVLTSHRLSADQAAFHFSSSWK